MSMHQAIRSAAARVAMFAVGLAVVLFLVAELRAHLVGDVSCPLSHLTAHRAQDMDARDLFHQGRRTRSLAEIIGLAFNER